MSRERTSRWWAAVVIITAGAMLVWTAGCASAPEDDGPDEVVGQPPAEDSEDYDPAPPPSHPGEHGQVGEEPGAGEPAVEPSGEPGVVTEQQVQRLKSFGPAVVMQHVEAEPVHEEDEFVGFKLVDVSQTAEAHMKPDLEVGDVVTHVNLVRLEQPEDYMEAWETLEDADEIRVDLLRDGEPKEVILQIH